MSILSSYLVVIGCLIHRRMFGAPLPPRRWSLGRFGLAINIIAVCFIIPLWFFAFWPTAVPVTPESMNWASVIFTGVLSIAIVYYIAKGRHEYDGPVALVKRDE